MAGRLTPVKLFFRCGTVRILVPIVRYVVLLGLRKPEFSETPEQTFETHKPRTNEIPTHITGWAVYLSDYEPASRPIGVPFPVTVVILLLVTASALSDLRKNFRHLHYEDQSVKTVSGSNRFSFWGSYKVDKYSVDALHVSFSAEVVYIWMVTPVH